MYLKLRKLRANQNLTCEEMAKKIGISKSYYWNLENASKNLSYAMAYKISNLYDMTPDELFLEDHEVISEIKLNHY